MARRRRVEPTEEWAELELLLEWPEQVEYEAIRPPVVFGSSVAERSRQTGTPETTLRRRISSFKGHGMRGLFEPEDVEGHSQLDPEVRGLILNLKSDYPPMRDNEIATICYVRFGERPHGRTVRRAPRKKPHSHQDVSSLQSLPQDRGRHRAPARHRDAALRGVEREDYGAPEILVSDGAGIFKANQAKAIYRSLGIAKETIEKRKPWQNYVETTFKIQKRMADYHFAKAESWVELVAAHDRWVEQCNTQMHCAHRHRKDGKRSPAEVLGFLTSVRRLPEDLERAFFSTRFTRVLDSLGYARIRHWKIYAEEELAKREVTFR